MHLPTVLATQRSTSEKLTNDVRSFCKMAMEKRYSIAQPNNNATLLRCLPHSPYMAIIKDSSSSQLSKASF